MQWSRHRTIIAALSGITGIGLAIGLQIVDEPEYLLNARQEDLVRILDDLNSREDDLQIEIKNLENAAQDLRRGNESAVVEEMQRRADALTVLAGTTGVTGPGLELIVADPEIMVSSIVFFDLINELRDAGAEAISVNDARVVANTGISEVVPGLQVGAKIVSPPYKILAIGDPSTLATALKIPGGVLEVLRAAGAITTVREKDSVFIEATVRPRNVPPTANN